MTVCVFTGTPCGCEAVGGKNAAARFRPYFGNGRYSNRLASHRCPALPPRACDCKIGRQRDAGPLFKITITAWLLIPCGTLAPCGACGEKWKFARFSLGAAPGFFYTIVVGGKRARAVSASFRRASRSGQPFAGAVGTQKHKTGDGRGHNRHQYESLSGPGVAGTVLLPWDAQEGCR